MMTGKHSLPADAQLGQRLKRHMAAHGLGGAALAERAGVRASFIYDILHGKSLHPSSIMLTKVAAALGVNVSDLVEGGMLAEAPAGFSPSSLHPGGGMVAIAPLAGGKKESAKAEASCYFSGDWLTARLGAAPAQLRVFTVGGDSMEPTLRAGDTVLVDVAKKQPSPPGLFAVFDGFAPLIIRLEYAAQPRLVRIIADNARYAPRELPLQEVHVMGRVVWFSRTL